MATLIEMHVTQRFSEKSKRCLYPPCPSRIVQGIMTDLQFKKRKYCSIAHARKHYYFKLYGRRDDPMPSPPPQDNSPRTRYADVTLESIKECKRCRASALRFVDVGKQCMMCGTVMYAGDGIYRQLGHW